MEERQGRAVLRERFTAAGLTIQEDYPFHEGVVAFSMDGYDPVARIGYEYITTAAGDREELTPQVLEGLEGLLREGRAQVLLIDEVDVADQDPQGAADALSRAADRFLHEARRRSEAAR